MKNIRSRYQLINGFKKQDRQSIWRHLDTLSNDPTVYSEQLAGIGPHLSDGRLYIYIDHSCLVLVCLDDSSNQDELADEEKFCDRAPRYFTANSSRISPVWQLSETLKLISQKLEENNLLYRLRGVLLSESNFFNADKVRPIWEEQDVTVIDNLKGLKGREIPVCANAENQDGVVAMHALESIVKKAGQNNGGGEADEFERLLNDFMNGLSAVKDEEEEEETVEEPDDDTTDETMEEEATDDDDSLSGDFPSGIIEQNYNLSVKVQILRPMRNPRAELDKLVGCQDIKRRLDELLAMTRYNKMLREAYPGAKLHEVSLHSIFFGRPGTGKTTVCKIFGSLLRETGALSKGHVVVANRGTFIGTLWGDEERSVNQVIEMAKGGVLIIDEAYLLNGKHESDPGKLVVQLLMDVLADEKERDTAVVLCGYKEPMMQLLDSNPGLHSRFPNRFEFKDFTIDDLLQISRRKVKEYQYHFTPQAWQKYKEVLQEAYRVRDPQSWGNARFVANQLERIFIRHAQRCTKGKPVKGKRLLTLTPADIVPIDVPRSARRMGF